MITAPRVGLAKPTPIYTVVFAWNLDLARVRTARAGRPLRLFSHEAIELNRGEPGPGNDDLYVRDDGELRVRLDVTAQVVGLSISRPDVAVTMLAQGSYGICEQYSGPQMTTLQPLSLTIAAFNSERTLEPKVILLAPEPTGSVLIHLVTRWSPRVPR